MTRRDTAWRVAASEALANAVSSPVRSLAIAGVAAVLAAAVVALSLVDVAGIDQRFRTQVADGRFVLVVRSPSRDGLDARRCEALRDVPGVRSAGAVLRPSSAFPAAAPLRPYDRLVVTPGLVAVWFPGTDAPTTGSAVGADAAQELGLVDGAVLQTAARSSRTHLALPRAALDRSTIGSVLPATVRNPEAGRLIFDVAAPTGSASACFVDPDPAASAVIESILVGWFGPQQPASVAPFRDEAAAGRAPEAELASRPSAWLWLAAALVIAALMTVLWYGRRDEFALYRLLGLRRGALAALLAVETLVTVAVPSLVGGTLALAACATSLEQVSRHDGGVPPLAPLVAADAAAYAAALALVPLAGLLSVGWRSTFAVLKGS